MHIELVTVGTELLLGFTVDTNGAHLGRTLAEAGIRVVRRTAVPDDPAAIASAVRDALQRTGWVITTGGLGPTRDDLTRPVLADLFRRPLRFDQDVWGDIVARFRRLGRELSAANRPQAEVPEGGVVLRNRWGTAPGLWLEGELGTVIMLPGVPREFRKLLEHEVLPRLRDRAGGRVIRSRTVRTTSLPESAVGQRVGPIEDALQPVSVAYLPGHEGVDVRLTVWDAEPAAAARVLDEAAARVAALLGDHVYGEDEEDLAAVLLEGLRQRGLRLAVAESCTGGLVGARVTDIPGSSDVFAGAAVCYDNALKTGLVGVPAELIASEGAVSEPVALAMAEGAARRFEVEAGIGVTGIAGPAGGTPDKPVGTVCFGWVVPGQRRSGRVVFPGGRPEIRARAAQYALFGLGRAMNLFPPSRRYFPDSPETE